MNFFDADRLTGKDGAEVDLFAPQTDPAAIGDDNHFVVKGIIDIGQSLIGTCRGEAFTALFSTEKRKVAGGETGYSGSIGNTKLTVWVDFGSRAAQLRYGMSIANSAGRIGISRLSYEDVWIITLGWDYLTEENVPRSVDLLCKQVVYLVRLVDRATALSST